jgi:Transposase DDE domain
VGTINTTDPDSRLVKTVGQRALQGYNAQAAVNEHQIIVAAEVTVDSPDFGHLEPMVDATARELARAGAESPAVVIADAGYWHKRQMENVVCRGIQVLIPPDSGLRKSARPGSDGGLYAFMRRVLSTEQGKALYRKRQATVEPVFGQIKFNRRFDRFLRRGRLVVRSEWRLFSASHNLLKLHSHRMRRRNLTPTTTRRPSFHPRATAPAHGARPPPLNPPFSGQPPLGKQLYRKRQVTIEPVFANTKFNRRIDRFLRRGRSAIGTTTRWTLWQAAASRSWSRPTPASAEVPGRAGTAAVTRSCAACSRPTTPRRSTETQGDRRAGLRADEVQPPAIRSFGRLSSASRSPPATYEGDPRSCPRRAARCGIPVAALRSSPPTA